MMNFFGNNVKELNKSIYDISALQASIFERLLDIEKRLAKLEKKKVVK